MINPDEIPLEFAAVAFPILLVIWWLLVRKDRKKNQNVNR